MQMRKTGHRTTDLQVGGRPLYTSAVVAYHDSSPKLNLAHNLHLCVCHETSKQMQRKKTPDTEGNKQLQFTFCQHIEGDTSLCMMCVR